MADQYMQCPQCGGELVILSDGKRQCQSCNMKYMLIFRDNAAEEGKPVTDQHNQCPQCGGELYMLSDGKRKCQSCGMKYILVPRRTDPGAMPVMSGAAAVGQKVAAGQKKKKSPVAVIAPIVAAVLLTAAAGVFLANSSLFGAADRAAEYAAYCESLMKETVPVVSADEAAEGVDIGIGDPLYMMGIVEEVGTNYIGLNNGVECNFDPDTLSDADLAALQEMLGSISVGDVIGVTGMVSDSSSSSFAMQYCGVPYIYYGGTQYYMEYENFRNGTPYPDTAYSEESYNEYLRLLEAGDVPYQTAISVLDSFKVDGKVTAESYYYGESLYGMHTPLSISGSVEKVADGYFVVDGISCFYILEYLSEEEKATINVLAVNDTVTVNGCVCNPYVDAFRMHYCYVTKHTSYGEPIDYVALPLDEQVVYMSAQMGYDTDTYRFAPVDLQNYDSFSAIRDAYVAVFYIENDESALESMLVLYADGTLKWLDPVGGLSEPIELLWGEFPMEFWYSSNAGGWGTLLTLREDGTFFGQYHDSDMGDIGDGYPAGTVYICGFEGRFEIEKQIDSYTFLLRLTELTTEESQDEEWIDGDVRYVASVPYGVESGTEFLLYRPGTPNELLTQEIINWRTVQAQPVSETDPLYDYAIQNVETGAVFFS